MIINISYIEYKEPLIKNMWYTAEPFYSNFNVDMENLKFIVKSDHRQISPYFYKFNQKNSANWDNSKQNCLILDIDDGMTIAEIQHMLCNHTYLIYTTKSHQKEKNGMFCDRFRLIIPAENIPRDEETYFVMLRLLRHRFKSDEQTEVKSAGFLCNSTAEIYTNVGDTFNCKWFANKAEYIATMEHKIKIIENEEKKQAREFRKEQFNDVDYELSSLDIKEQLTLELMIEIVDSLGLEVTNRGKCSIRDERSPSTQLYADGGVHDFGGDSIDIFELVMRQTGISFRDSLKYVNNFL